MGATTSSVNKVTEFVDKLRDDYPEFSFIAGERESWSPKNQTITYLSDQPLKQFQYCILHELAHAQLGHTTYKGDFELLKLESMAWELAAKIGKNYGVEVSDEHIQNCLDTYRDWLHKRSTCPTCQTRVLQSTKHSYKCYNCGAVWQVSNRLVRPYRRLKRS